MIVSNWYRKKWSGKKLKLVEWRKSGLNVTSLMANQFTTKSTFMGMEREVFCFIRNISKLYLHTKSSNCAEFILILWHDEVIVVHFMLSNSKSILSSSWWFYVFIDDSFSFRKLIVREIFEVLFYCYQIFG